MTDTGQVPGEGQPANAGGQPERHGPSPSGAYTYQAPAAGAHGQPGGDDDDMLLMPGSPGAWGEPGLTAAPPLSVPAAPDQGAAPGPHEAAGRDSAAHGYGTVRSPADGAPQHQPVSPAAERRPLHLGPPVPEQSGAVLSLADRGPNPVPPASPAAPEGPAGAGPDMAPTFVASGCHGDAGSAPQGLVTAAVPGAPDGGFAEGFVGGVPPEAAGADGAGAQHSAVNGAVPGAAFAGGTSADPAASNGAVPDGGPAEGNPGGAPGHTAPAEPRSMDVSAPGFPDLTAPPAAGLPPEPASLPGPQLGRLPEPPGAWSTPVAATPDAPAETGGPVEATAPAPLPGPDLAALPPLTAPPAEAAPSSGRHAGPAETGPTPLSPGDAGPGRTMSGDAAFVNAGADGSGDSATGVPASRGSASGDLASGAVPASAGAGAVSGGEAVPSRGEAPAGGTVDVTPEDEAPGMGGPVMGAVEVVDPASVGAVPPVDPSWGSPAPEAVTPTGADPVGHVPDAEVGQGQTGDTAGPATSTTVSSTAPSSPSSPFDAEVPQPSAPQAMGGPVAQEAAPVPQPSAGTGQPDVAQAPAGGVAEQPVGEPGTVAPATGRGAERQPAFDVVPEAVEHGPVVEVPQTGPAQVTAPENTAPADAGPPVAGPASSEGSAPSEESPQESGPATRPEPVTDAPNTVPALPASDTVPAAVPAPAVSPVPPETPSASPSGAVPTHDAVQTHDGAAVPTVPGPRTEVAAAPPPAAASIPAPDDVERGTGPDHAGERRVAPAPETAERPGEPAPSGYADTEREALHRVMRERRDIRNGFRPDPIPHEVLLRVLEAAHTAPSVGHSQPWDFVVIRSAETRQTMHELAARQRAAYAKTLPKGRAKQFKEMKIEAILETPVNIVVTADPTRGGRHTLGRQTQPQMAPYSSALAVENLWLAARAEGLGVGWVSFFDEREMVRALDLPEHLEIVAYLCVGYVDAFPDEPELVQAGWSRRRPLSWVVHEESYGRRALPGAEPHDLLAETLSGIRPLDAKALGEAWERQKRMTKPSGALGMLEIISAQLSGLSRKCPPPIPEPAAVAVFAGDHGVHAQGVTSWPQEVTGQMVANFLGGGAVCNAFANQAGAEVCVIDVGVVGELPATPGLLPRKVRPGTGDITTGPALSREEVLKAVEVGIETARDLVSAGNRALLTGEMGIANTTVSAALISVFTGGDPAEVTGRGTGISDEMHGRKIDVVRRALELHQPDAADPIGVLAAVGGLEHAALVGLILGGASLRTPVILDGVSAGAAALAARAIAPEALAACIAGHRSAEPGHVAALTKLGLRPLVDLDLRLGEGTGALLALPVVQSAARAMHEVATFDSAGVTEKN